MLLNWERNQSAAMMIGPSVNKGVRLARKPAGKPSERVFWMTRGTGFDALRLSEAKRKEEFIH